MADKTQEKTESEQVKAEDPIPAADTQLDAELAEFRAWKATQVSKAAAEVASNHHYDETIPGGRIKHPDGHFLNARGKAFEDYDNPPRFVAQTDTEALPE